jgi:hypothetical protein
MLRRFRPFEASPIYQFKDPDTGHLYKEPSLKQLYTAIITYRIQNRLDAIEHLKEVVENYLCGLPENCNKCQPNEQLHRSMYTYIKGGVALLKNMFFQKFVTQTEAEKRAEQCVTCEYNVFPDKGPFMAWADEIAISQVGERKCSKDKYLGSCAVCTCVLKSKVHFDGTLEKFPEEELVKLKSVKCWQLKLSGQE